MHEIDQYFYAKDDCFETRAQCGKNVTGASKCLLDNPSSLNEV